MQILLVEDDRSLSDGLCRALNVEGFVTNAVALGREALHVVAASPPDIVVLDLGLPDMDGLDLLKQIRRQGCRIPVLVLTARASVDARVTGLDEGADDYLAKPFDTSELIARLRVIGRRLGTSADSQIQLGHVALDTVAKQVHCHGELLDLSRREYSVLKLLMENAGRVQTREQMESRLYAWGEEISSNAIEVHVHHLRKKLGSDFIKTVRGVGYTIARS